VDTRETILTAAQKLFARFGFNKTTVDEIARATHCGVKDEMSGPLGMHKISK
jgi:AcrR family transcriptional regulator